MASAWLRLAAERTVHGSDQKIHDQVDGARRGDARSAPGHTRGSNRRRVRRVSPHDLTKIVLRYG